MPHSQKEEAETVAFGYPRGRLKQRVQ